jgi:hypothetical protein
VKPSHGWARATPVFDDERLVSLAGVNPAGKATSITAGMAADADSIDDLDVIRSGGMPALLAEGSSRKGFISNWSPCASVDRTSCTQPNMNAREERVAVPNERFVVELPLGGNRVSQHCWTRSPGSAVARISGTGGRGE